MTKISLFLVVMTLLVAGALSQGPTNPVAQEQLDNLLKWQSKFQEKFPAQQALYRALVLNANSKMVKEHNADKTQTYTMEVNQFSIYTPDELKDMIMQTRPEYASIKSVQALEKEAVADIANQNSNGVGRNLQVVSATSLLWDSAMTAVKNQGRCGSCWAFGTIAAVESMYKKTKGLNLVLAEQQLVDCTYPNATNGCNGGWPSYAFDYIKSKRVFTNLTYPYLAIDQDCKAYSISGSKYPITSYSYAYNGGNCASTKSQLVNGPIEIAVDATYWGPYKTGIFSGCNTTNINHAVLLVGYDTSGNWKIKNSWGIYWGESGYIRVSPSGSACGICYYSWRVTV